MAQGNGTAAPTDKTAFTIGGQEILVPAISLYDLEQRKEVFAKLENPEIVWSDYSGCVLDLICALIEPDDLEKQHVLRLELAKKCSIREARDLIEGYGRLLRSSGLIIEGEVQAAMENPGTGMLTLSPPN